MATEKETEKTNRRSSGYDIIHLKPRFEILELLNSRGKITAREAADKLRYDIRTMSTMLCRYHKKGWLSTIPAKGKANVYVLGDNADDLICPDREV